MTKRSIYTKEIDLFQLKIKIELGRCVHFKGAIQGHCIFTGKYFMSHSFLDTNLVVMIEQLKLANLSKECKLELTLEKTVTVNFLCILYFDNHNNLRVSCKLI